MAQRILLLADISSSHTEKWAVALAEKGYHIGIFTLNKATLTWHTAYKTIDIVYEAEINPGFILNKLKYLWVLPNLLKCIRSFNPDLIHAHYASSYGLLGALSNFKPFIISAWGSDIYEFPKKSFLHKAILKFNLKTADRISSTSHVMKEELWKYSSKEVEVIPFGVDTKVFFPRHLKPAKEKDVIYIGTIKAMEDIYGIKTIIDAVELVKICLPDIPIKVYLIGAGNKTAHYKAIVHSKNLDDCFVFTGKISSSDISNYHNLLDILLNVSHVNESFGVSVIEGMACGKAVIVSNAAGLKEVIATCGIVVEKENIQQLAKAIMHLIESPELRMSLGKFARKHVLDNYDLKDSLKQMICFYDSVFQSEENVVSEALN